MIMSRLVSLHSIAHVDMHPRCRAYLCERVHNRHDIVTIAIDGRQVDPGAEASLAQNAETSCKINSHACEDLWHLCSRRFQSLTRWHGSKFRASTGCSSPHNAEAETNMLVSACTRTAQPADTHTL